MFSQFMCKHMNCHKISLWESSYQFGAAGRKMVGRLASPPAPPDFCGGEGAGGGYMGNGCVQLRRQQVRKGGECLHARSRYLMRLARIAHRRQITKALKPLPPGAAN